MTGDSAIFFLFGTLKGRAARPPSLLLCHEGSDPMSNLQIIEELCGICADMAHIILEQKKVLAQYDASVLEDEIEKTRTRYQQLIGANEWPGLQSDGR
jgi:hypothetical protein